MIASRQSSVNSAQRTFDNANAELMRANQSVNAAQQKVSANDAQLADYNKRLFAAQHGANRNAKFPSIQRSYLQTITDINRQISSRQSFWRMDQQSLSSLKNSGISPVKSGIRPECTKFSTIYALFPNQAMFKLLNESN
jgi:predicted  nucleic acid-binding Zn-ribbon protein